MPGRTGTKPSFWISGSVIGHDSCLPCFLDLSADFPEFQKLFRFNDGSGIPKKVNADELCGGTLGLVAFILGLIPAYRVGVSPGVKCDMTAGGIVVLFWGAGRELLSWYSMNLGSK